MKKYKVLEAKWHIDFPEGFRCRFINSSTEKKVLHAHEYYEIFLTLTDDITHIINGKTENLKKGSLVFIRPNDVHLYKNDEKPYRFINFAFSKELAKALFDFLSEDLNIDEMLNCPMPPTIPLSSSKCKKTANLFQTINYVASDNHLEKRLQCKSILTTLFTKYFSRFSSNDNSNDIPIWLSQTYEQMKSVKNFYNGIPAMVEISGKTYEHLSRCMKKYYNITVTEYINLLRLNYAANLLVNTNYSLTDIYLECGFSNQTYFSTCFKRTYGMTPTAYRKK
jgi:AraC family cel operon transcriptional repressor